MLHTPAQLVEQRPGALDIGFRAAGGWEVSVFARNLFNENYLQNVTVQAGNSGLILGTPSDPRMFGVMLRARQ